jgi:hypothetical protein
MDKITTKKITKNIENETTKKFLTILLALVILFSAGLYVRAEKIERNLRNVDFKPAVTPTPLPTVKIKAEPTIQPEQPAKTEIKESLVPIITPTSVPLVPVVLRSGTTVYCRPEGAGAVKDADNAYYEGLQKYESCVNEARAYNSEQLTTCRNFCNDSYTQCFNSCQNALNPDSDYCQGCLTRKTSCFDDCTKTHSDVNLVKSCEAYYSLQKNNLENLKKVYCE